MNDALGERGKALEDSFFQQKDKVLLEKLREEYRTQGKRDALSEVSGIADEALLDELIQLQIEPPTFATFSLLPLIKVAWADGKVQKAEREAILAAAEQSGITKSSAAFEILDGWMEEPPSNDLYEAWKHYAHTLKSSLGEDQASKLQSNVLGRAREVAEAAGGFLGFGNKVSDEEAEVLEELAAAFN